MATQTIRQTMFTIGEVDVTNYKRTDFQDYLKGAQSLLNIEVGTTGLAKKRKGTKFVQNMSSYVQFNSNGYEFVDKFGNYFIVVSVNLFFHIFSITNGVVAFYQTIASPYTTADLDFMDDVEDNDSLIFSVGTHKPGRIFIQSYGPVVFAFELLNIYPFPAYDFGKIDYNNFTVSLTGDTTTITFQFTGLASDPGFTTAWIGGQIIGGGVNADDPLGYAIITNVIPWDGTKVVFTGNVQVPFKIAGASTKGSQYSVRQPAWSDALGWPKKISFYQNRLWFGNTDSLRTTMFGSQINKPINFDVGIGADTDAIIYNIGQTDCGSITWINSGKQLEIYTDNFEFVAPQDVNTALTPATFSIRQQDAYGCSNNLKPINYANDSFYVSKTGKAFIDYRFDGVGQAYTSTSVSVASSHLIKNPINRAILRGTDNSQDNFIYLLNSDQSITCFQFALQIGLAAFTPLQFQVGDSGMQTVEIIDIFTVNNEVYFLKLYSINNTHALDKFVDDVKLDSYITSTMNETGLVTGLEILNGYSVTVLFDNQDYGTYTVVDGHIEVFNPNEMSGTVQVGLLYPVQITTMYLFSGPEQSNWFKQITQVDVDYYNSLDFYVNDIFVPYQQFVDVQEQIPPPPQTGTQTIFPVMGYNKQSVITITQNAPFDLQILGISYDIASYKI